MLAGVDASAGVSSQGDPRPVLFRITGPAWTAAEDGAAMQVDVAGCTVTGAAHGDLSSEKIYARLRTMTCAGPGFGTVIETDVAGFVAGSGKVGVRGPVVSREGALVEKAFLAGMISGVGQGLSQAFQPQAVGTGGGAAVANTGLGDIGPRRSRLGRGERRAEGRRLHDPPRRTVPAGDPARGRNPRHAGVSRRRTARRAGGREIGKPRATREGIDMTRNEVLKRPLPAMIVLGALALGGCSGTNVGSSWQCPLARGGTCDSVATADPAVPQGASVPQAASVPAAVPVAGAARKPVLREPLYRVRGGGRAEAAAQPCDGGCSFDPFAWLARLFGADPGSGARPGLDPGAGARDDGEAGSRPADAGPMKIAPEIGSAPSQTAGADPAIESAIGTPALPVGPEPSAALRTVEVVARIWIAPFVDANGVYREAANVRVVLEPAGWRVP